MRIDVPYGKTSQSVDIPDNNLIGIISENPLPAPELTGKDEVLRALRNPIGSKKLSDIVKPKEKIAVITSDITRPMPTREVLPCVIEELLDAGVDLEDVTVVFAIGSHRKQTAEEQKKLVGEDIYEKVRCVDSDPNDCVRLGTTEFGTPVDITRVVAEADRRICLGNIEYHYFAGYSGGAKAIMPGVSSRDAIQSNHSRMVEKTSCAANLDGNNVRADIEESAAMCGIDFIVNVVLDGDKRIIKAVAGDAVKAHREGCRFLDTLYRAKIRSRADIVIASNGGTPKDLNLYQTQKALNNAMYAVKKGGIVILVGACGEGLGEKTFERWLREAPTAHSLIERVQTNFELGGHKAAAIAVSLEDADVYLVSEMPKETVEKCFLKPFKSLEKAYSAAVEVKGSEAKVIVMPHAGSTLPEVTELK